MSESNAHNADLSALKIDRSRKSGVPGRWKRWLHLLWLLVPVVVYFGYQYTLKEVTPAQKVKLTTIRYLAGSDAAAELVATGYVVAQIKAAVSSKGTGRLATLKVEEGDTVVAGQVIARLENEDMIANLSLYEAYLKQHQADSLAAGLNHKRQSRLHQTGGATDEILERATADYHRALANVEAGLAQVRAAEVAVENTIIRAPFDGTVLTKDADVGEMVAPMAASASSRGAVVTIADMSSLEVEADVSESNIQKVIVGQPCEIILDAYPSQKYTGFVKKIVPTADRSRATVMVKVAFVDKDDRVLPEMSARVNFMPPDDNDATLEPEPVLVVDNDAVVMRQGRGVLFRLDNEYARLTEVSLGRKLGSVTEVLSGPASGTSVILNPPGALVDGDKVSVSK
ncbi:MAG: efflux RND transporter periplasmic adaptor subunit [candidate division Zixibacteria bacterium]|nr:efflux RND transporter periplasmic adaptor subunit [candidate division Zixibacteria bacterium]MDH3936224.1 efflux RND transporter periplasmic adaptor subunit [candidate division Zixibacteria bacterium]MDH4032742.1 efflux RND transporter periplasmic adaptor subunit [candidate division Zixibacteria bacterium]